MRSINCNGNLIELSRPAIMGIINLTPDSFYDGGRLKDSSDILRQAEEMLTQGATFLDMGGYSSRPGASDVPPGEEIRRVIPAIGIVARAYPEAIISVDTFRSEVARAAVEEGAAMINDISGGEGDEKMFETAGTLAVPYICMHMRGTPATMSSMTDYQDITSDLIRYFSGKIAQANKAGVNDIILDPGFGFAKTQQQNFKLLDELSHLKVLEKPLLVGISRKSMVYKTLDTDPVNALNGTTVLHTVALLKGADILRVHDVKEAVECVRLVEHLP